MFDGGERDVEVRGRAVPGVPTGHGGAVVTDRIVKYIANSAAKNISSLESQTMVPTRDHVGPVWWP